MILSEVFNLRLNDIYSPALKISLNESLIWILCEYAKQEYSCSEESNITYHKTWKKEKKKIYLSEPEERRERKKYNT